MAPACSGAAPHPHHLHDCHAPSTLEMHQPKNHYLGFNGPIIRPIMPCSSRRAADAGRWVCGYSPPTRGTRTQPLGPFTFMPAILLSRGSKGRTTQGEWAMLTAPQAGNPVPATWRESPCLGSSRTGCSPARIQVWRLVRMCDILKCGSEDANE